MTPIVTNVFLDPPLMETSQDVSVPVQKVRTIVSFTSATPDHVWWSLYPSEMRNQDVVLWVFSDTGSAVLVTGGNMPPVLRGSLKQAGLIRQVHYYLTYFGLDLYP
eukprot:GHVU01037555.1.p1 GENE.GHVU01037555.1~~GHVU01037555.1.p1  ORF type:complete len:106 (+),score=5.77 GHVU01037555.1:233-550(+)